MNGSRSWKVWKEYIHCWEFLLLLLLKHAWCKFTLAGAVIRWTQTDTLSSRICNLVSKSIVLGEVCCPPRACMEQSGTFICVYISFLPSVRSWIIEQNALRKVVFAMGFADTANCTLLGLSLSFGIKQGALQKLERRKGWWNSSLLPTAPADSSVCRSNRWPWSWVARKLVIKYFNSDWFGNLRFVKSRVKSFAIQMARCFISPYFSWTIFGCSQRWIQTLHFTLDRL